MGQTYDSIPDYIIEWIPKQHMFWVATAPQALNGHINISPKGVAGTFHVVGPTQVWYEDLSGTGAETIAHIRENGRITILFNAFEGPPRIARLYGKGSYHEFGSAEYNRLLPLGTRQPGSRAVIIVDVWKVAATCGYSVPYYTFNGHRVRLLDWAAKREKIDNEEAETQGRGDITLHPKGMAAWWRDRNMFSLDGLPALSTAFNSVLGVGLHKPVPKSGAPRPHQRQSPGTELQPLSITISARASSLILEAFVPLCGWVASALTAMILSSPVIGYPPLSAQSTAQNRATLPHGHKMGSSSSVGHERRMNTQMSSILGYALTFLLGVLFATFFGAMSRPIDGLSWAC